MSDALSAIHNYRAADDRLGTSGLPTQAQLADVEDSIQHARRYYNGSARDLNNLVEQFPSNFVARAAGFTTVPFFELEASQGAAREPVAVKF